MIKLLRTAAFLLCTAVAAPAMAQDFDKGMEAYQAGDYETALQEWRPLAEQGHVRAQVQLGHLYKNGNRVIQSHAEAAKWYRLAAEQGSAHAQTHLGHLYNNPYSPIRDDNESAKWHRMAAEQGSAFSQNNLGYLYERGDGVILDVVRAHMWFNISSANGDARGSSNRGEVEELMTHEQIVEAQALAQRCMSSNYQDCG
jgi:TPR repeat protein